MTSLSLQRTAVVGLIASVHDIGVVHNRERNAARDADFLQLYRWENAGSSQVRGWNVRRVDTQERPFTIGTNIERHTWEIRGFMAFSDKEASEIVFDDLIEAVRDAYRADPTIGGVIVPVVDPNEYGIQVVESKPVLLAGVLCHSCRLSLKTEREI